MIRFPTGSLALAGVLTLLLSVLAVADAPGFVRDEPGFQRTVRPFLQRHCERCHGAADAQGEFRVDTQLSTDFLNLAAQSKWGEVVNVLNSHEMPPEDEPQPSVQSVTEVVDWITHQMAHAELYRRDSAIILRRLNRSEYQHTIRDLVGVDFDIEGFPQDAQAGGFDNNGSALTVSPLHLELYYSAAQKILDQALVDGPQPSSLKWKIEPDSGDSDSNRVTYDGQRLIVNGGKNQVENGFKVMHHESWDRKLNARDFALPYEGEYVIRIRAGGRVPTRAQVVESASGFLKHRMDEQALKNPKGGPWLQEQFDRDLEHFRTDRMYEYGPPRLKLITDLGGQPRVITEFDVAASVESPQIYEVRTRFTTQRAGMTVDYGYSVPRELENFWMQGHDNFARPELWVDWFELEGPVYDSWPPRSHQMVLIDSPHKDRDERAYARDVLARFMRRAYRRPVSDQEIEEKVSLFDLARPDAPSFVQAIKLPLSAVLVSPHFLYLAEPASRRPEVAGFAPATPAVPAAPLNLFDVIELSIDQPRTSNRDQTLMPVFLDGDTPLMKTYRQFIDRRGRKVRGRIVSVEGSRVKMQRVDGGEFVVSLNDFSNEDREFIRSLQRAAVPDPASNRSEKQAESQAPTNPGSPAQTAAQPVVAASLDASREPASGSPSRQPLTQHELAARLSYFLWSSMPDDELSQLADDGKLGDDASLIAQVDRLLADPKSRAFVENFTGQWLGLREVGSNPPAADLYPRYDRHLELSIVEESQAFFAEILHNDLSVMNFVRSDFVVINERLARFYGIPGVKGDDFRRVDVPDGVHRGGIVTQASVLTITSNGTRTSPVKRGTWVMTSILGMNPGLPVANAGDIAPKVPGIDKATVRQRLEIHRTLPQCARCHNKIDPLGFSLENFNAAGEWRDREGFGYKGRISPNDPLVDASAKMIDGTEFVGVDGLQELLTEKKELFLNCLAGKLLTYALGREPGVADQLHIKAAVAHSQQNDESLRSMIRFIATSEPFRLR